MRPDPYKQKASRNYKKNNPESKDADSNPKPIKNNSQKEKNSSKIKDTPSPQVERSESKPSTNKLGVSKAGPGNQIGIPKSYRKREIVDNSWRYLEQEEESEDEINAEVSALLKYFDEKKNESLQSQGSFMVPETRTSSLGDSNIVDDTYDAFFQVPELELVSKDNVPIESYALLPFSFGDLGYHGNQVKCIPKNEAYVEETVSANKDSGKELKKLNLKVKAKTLDNSPKGKIKNQDITNTTPMANKLFKAEISNNDGNVRKSSNAPSKMGKSSMQDVTDWLDGII